MNKSETPIVPVVGRYYNWRWQNERLVFLGTKVYSGDLRRWYQFAKIGTRNIWCEVLASDLVSFEETPDTDIFKIRALCDATLDTSDLHYNLHALQGLQAFAKEVTPAVVMSLITQLNDAKAQLREKTDPVYPRSSNETTQEHGGTCTPDILVKETSPDNVISIQSSTE